MKELTRSHRDGQCHKEDTHGVESGAFFKLLMTGDYVSLRFSYSAERHTHFRVLVLLVEQD